MDAIKLAPLHADQLRAVDRFRGYRRSVLRCGRRWGKTILLEKLSCRSAAQGKKVGWFSPTYKIVTPTYRHVHETLRPAIQSASRIDSLITVKNGGSVEFWTLQDEDAGRSRSYDLVIIDEASLVKSKLKDIFEQSIAPTLLDRQGIVVMAGTPKGIDPDSYFYMACTEPEMGWTEFYAPTASNPTLNAAAVAKLKDEYPPLVYDQEYRAQFVDWAGAAFFSRDKMLEDGEPVDPGDRYDMVYAVIDTALKDKSEHDATGIIYFAHNRPLPNGEFSQRPLVVLDWDLIQVESDLLSDWLPSVYTRMETLAREYKARMGWTGPYIEDKASGITLLQHCQRHGMPAEALPSKLTALGKEGRALNISGYVHQGMVKLSRYAFDKATDYRGKHRNHMLSQVCGFRIGEKELHEMDLLDCFTSGVAIALGNSEGF